MKPTVRTFGKPIRWNRAYAILVLCGLTGFSGSAQTLTTLHTFDITDGQYPGAGLVQGLDGSFYGTTSHGGDGTCGGVGTTGCGVIFEISAAGTFTRLYSFCAELDCPDGAWPSGAMVQATNGDLYGTTSYGGNVGGAMGWGTLFRLAPSGSLTTLHRFCSQNSNHCPDGYDPDSGLTQGPDGEFYGTTAYGGAGNSGTFFKITQSGQLTTLYAFCSVGNCTDGQDPSGLVLATNGDFYGTTGYGGAHSFGTVFETTPSGKLTTLYAFCSEIGCTDGATPYGTLVEATNGELYGTTLIGGVCSECGTVFKITLSGKLTTLYAFCAESGCPDGEEPLGGLVQGTDGNLYGVTQDGGNSPVAGTIFKITPSGSLTTIYSFCAQTDCSDGSTPNPLIQGTDGNFYGTTYGGQANLWGTVFSLSTGLGPFVKTLHTSGKIGALVEILGTNLTGATSVTFNGVPAAFTVQSASLITTTVPTGATTGTIEVATPSGTLSSYPPFRVLP